MPSRKKPRRTVSPTDDPIANILSAWRLWLLGALIGALVAWLLYQIAQPDYRARATVVVDNNLERAWVFFPDRQLFQFLARETERLEELAWSDAVMQQIMLRTGIAIEELRDGMLVLSHPSDGGWHFYADNADSQTAQTLAAAWAQAFVDAARAAVEVSPELETARAELSAEVQEEQPDEARIRALTEEMAALAEQSQGISLYTELSVNQSADLPVERSVSLATYLLVGSALGAIAAPLYVLLRPARTPRCR